MNYTINTNCNPNNEWWQPVLSTDAVSAKRCYVNDQATYMVLNATTENEDTRHYRSVIIDHLTLSVLSFAPPKSITLEQFMEKHSDVSTLKCSEIIEGTMVNLFYDPKINTWEIATKSCVGGNNHYFRTQYEFNRDWIPQLSFRDMFLDALGVAANTPMNDVPFIQTLDQQYMYSFVLQHPYNHIVLPIAGAALYLVAVFRTVDADTTFGEIPWTGGTMRGEKNRTVIQTVPLETVGVNIKSPATFNVSSYEDVQTVVARSNVGVMLYDEVTGDRTTIFAPDYIAKKELRGNHPNLQYQFLQLIQNNSYSQFLDTFPMYNYMFEEFHKLNEQLFADIHYAYLMHFVKRQRDMFIDKPIFCFAHRLHNDLYIPSQFTLIVNKREIRKYFFERLTVKEQFYLLNYKTMVPKVPVPEPLRRCYSDE
jgi:hypothetical protein